jgi:hypothetical protein
MARIFTDKRRNALALCVALAALLHSCSSWASSSYPNRIKARWAVSGKLPAGGQDGCLLCHTKEAGGLNTATKPFAQTLRQKYNVTGADDDALLAALDKLKKNADDSDRDGFSDYEEVATAGTDPNDATDKPEPPPPTGTGGELGASGGPGEPAGGGGGAPGSGGTPSTGGAPGAGASPEDPEPEFCTPEQKIYPTPEYGCQFGAGSRRGVPLFALLLSGLGFLARRSRGRRQLR